MGLTITVKIDGASLNEDGLPQSDILPFAVPAMRLLAKRMQQKELAEKSGVGWQSLGRLERGETTRPLTVQKVLQALEKEGVRLVVKGKRNGAA